LKDELDQKNKNLEILQKSKDQKERHLAAIYKENEKLHKKIDVKVL